MTDRLFDVPDLPPDPTEEMSAGRRLTARNQAMLEVGRHPATLTPLRAEGGRCGDCEHCHRYGWHDRKYVKCGKHRLGESHSEASDIRVGWPACSLFEVRSSEQSD